LYPISDGTFSVVPVRNNIHTIPHSAPGNAVMMMNGSNPRLKIHHHQQVDQNYRKHQANCPARKNEEAMVSLPGHESLPCFRVEAVFSNSFTMAGDIRRHTAQIAILRARIDVRSPV